VIAPETAEFAVLCWEGPDRYALAGGLGSRITGLTEALAGAGYTTHLFFIGDPALPGLQAQHDGRLVLHRWCQWISAHHPGGVYDGEEGKWRDYTGSAPRYLVEEVVPPAVAAGHRLFVLAEEWQTAAATCVLSDMLAARGLRAHATCVWNANNVFGFDRVDWGRLTGAATLTTVSRFMKHLMWARGLNPLVVPNGIPEAWLLPPAADDVAALRAALRSGGAAPCFVKVGRWDPDKRWHMAVGAVAALRAAGTPARLVCKGGMEPHGAEVLRSAAQRGLRVTDVRLPEGAGPRAVAAALAAEAGDAPVVNLKGFLAPATLAALYAAADAVLANSGMEPFGLVGLEAMAAGALVFVGTTGEDYAIPLDNAVVVETDDPGEIARDWLQLAGRPERQAALRSRARATAQAFRWDRVLQVLLSRLDYLAATAGR
jgi:glycosyltransferase involved in cell wall biosynthesis